MEGAPPDQAFHMNAEIEIQNLKELNDVLQQVHEQSFRSHVSDKKNDFASWVRHSVKDEELALKLEKTLDFEQTKKIIANRILELVPPKIEEPVAEEKDLDTESGSLNLNFDEIDLPPVPPGTNPYKETPVKEEIKEAMSQLATATKAEPLTLPKLPNVPEIPQIKAEIHPFQNVKHKFISVLVGFISGIFAGFVLGVAYMIWLS